MKRGDVSSSSNLIYFSAHLNSAIFDEIVVKACSFYTLCYSVYVVSS